MLSVGGATYHFDVFNPVNIANLVYDLDCDGVDIDYVAAHVCLNIAAMRGCKQSAEYRKELAADMNSDEISQAQREARALIQMIKSKTEN